MPCRGGRQVHCGFPLSGLIRRAGVSACLHTLFMIFSEIMTTPKLQNIWAALRSHLLEGQIPHAMIGALALSQYGVVRYTADIDLLVAFQDKRKIVQMMETLNFDCFQDTDMFAQFDTEYGIWGKVDFLFVQTDEGRDILDRAVIVTDDILGEISVVQPTGYAVLKLMAIANNPERQLQDIADLEALIKASTEGHVDSVFTPLDMNILRTFARRFGVLEKLVPLLPAFDKKR